MVASPCQAPIITVNRQLQQFIQVATCRNLSQAARHLGVTQPTLTHNMRRLEERLGVTLYQRNSSGITLTEAGLCLLEQAREIEALYQQTHQRLQRIRDRQHHALRIGTGHAWWHGLLLPVVSRYCDAHPAASLNIQVGNHLRLLDLLAHHEIDLFIGHEIHGLAEQSQLHFEPLLQAEDALFVRTGHPLSHTLCSKQAEKQRMGIDDKFIHTTNSMMVAMDLLRGSNMIMPFPRQMGEYLGRQGLLPLRMSEEYNRGIIGVYYRQGEEWTTMLRLLQQEAARHRQG
ncbi:LysR family transcriptional regulator [Aeromonas schubertii]|uniref:LysR family transcriptional regulator n=1 Tax=Aeromonas schubertii TaxID=652 RepID=A0A0S2SCQ7_9GAMM|nr:LysR family transcriptional regulator [Aeromonas schubertii]ALP39472.1 LysR family transcriptional regulator [Aeromonas schubertii]